MQTTELSGTAPTGRACAAARAAEAAEVEIVVELKLAPQQATMLDLHSVLNILTILLGELRCLRHQLTSPQSWERTVRVAERITDDLRAGKLDRSGLEALEGVEAGFDEETGLAVHARELPAAVQLIITNVRSLLRVLAVRLAEYLDRLERPREWVPHAVRDLEVAFSGVLAAIEKNSKGRYRIVSNIARQQPRDYVVELRIESDEGDTLTMPPVIQDVFRDLIANARKYSEPGGIILAGLHRSDQELVLVVEDLGLGIPPSELARVVEFGYRATNVRALPTAGGGFGLTRAWWVTRRFGGRMWIRSRVGAGTRITIRIPVPQSRVTPAPSP